MDDEDEEDDEDDDEDDEENDEDTLAVDKLDETDLDDEVITVPGPTDGFTSDVEDDDDDDEDVIGSGKPGILLSDGQRCTHL